VRRGKVICTRPRTASSSSSPHQRQVHLGQELRRRELGPPATNANGRPIEVRRRPPDKSFDTVPGPYGAHNWHPMSFQPQHRAGLPAGAEHTVNLTAEELEARRQAARRILGNLGWNVGLCHQRDAAQGADVRPADRWDPVKQKEAWRQGACLAWNGGTLTTAATSCSRVRRRPLRRLQRHHGREAVGLADRHWRRGRGIDLYGRRQAVCVGGRGLGRVYGVTARATEHNDPGTFLPLRGWQGVTASLYQVSDGEPPVGREYDPACWSGHSVYV